MKSKSQIARIDAMLADHYKWGAEMGKRLVAQAKKEDRQPHPCVLAALATSQAGELQYRGR